jgi:hypothetical protein
MMPTITSIQMGKIIRESIEMGDKKPMLFLGKTGIGKTETVKTICDEQTQAEKEKAEQEGREPEKFGHIDIRILNHTETDFKGLPYPDKEHVFTVYLQNKMFPIEERDGKRGILVLDEVTSGFRSVRTAIYQLLQERRIGEYVLPDGWQIICLGNGENDGGDFNGIESAFGARCRCFRVESTTADYLKFGNKTGVSDLVLAFLEFSPESLHTYNAELDGTENCLGFACNRAWSSVSDLLKRKGITMDSGSLSEIDRLNIQGGVGTEEGMKFLTFVDLRREVVSCVDIANGKNVKAPKRQETLFLTATGLKALMAEMTDTCEFDGRDETLSEELMTKIANCLYWLCSGDNDVTIELTMSTIQGYCDKSKYGADLFIGDKFDNFCKNSPKYKIINEWLDKHSLIFDLD